MYFYEAKDWKLLECQLNILFYVYKINIIL